MIVGYKRYCDECNSDNAQRYVVGYVNAQRYVVGYVVRDYCIKCAIQRKLF